MKYRAAVNRHSQFHKNPIALTFPVAGNRATYRTVRTIYPFQVLHKPGVQIHPVEADGIDGRFDTTQPVIKPLADRAKHRVVMTVGVVTECPMFPEGGRPVL